MVQLLSRYWKDELAGIVSSAKNSVLVVAPFIKYNEAVWFCGLLKSGIEVITLANVDVDAVATSALDLTALRCFAEASPSSRLIALSSLHAKVFVADEEAAIITSGNLTRSAFNNNLEYGVLLHEPNLVHDIREDMLAFASLGSQLTAETVEELVPLEAELRQARADIVASATPAAKNKFNEVMRQAKPAFASTQVGNRSAHSVFGEAIQFVLARRPQTTKVIQQEVSRLMPALCDDSEILFIKGERYGKAWKRRFRHAQLHLKRRGIVAYNPATKEWSLVGS